MVSEPSSPRRSPQGAARQRDAERSKRVILDSAIKEFARYGYAGARVNRIADRAGLNKQLISYYFGGKEGLRDAVDALWRASEGGLYEQDMELAEVVGNYVRANVRYADVARLLHWEALGDYVPDRKDSDARNERMRRYVEDVARRQETGELPAGIDPRAIALALFAASGALVAFTPIAKAMGIDKPFSEETSDWYAEELERLVRALRADS